MKTADDRASRKLKERNFKLNTLLEVSNAINNLEYDLELYDHYKKILVEKLSLGKVALISDYYGWSININVGDHNMEVESLFPDILHFDRITVLNDSQHSVLSKYDVIIPIIHKSKPLAFLLLGDFDGEKIEVSPIIRHLPFIQTLTNLVVVAQENKRLFEESIEKAAMQKELELASRMQDMLIPKRIPERKDLDIHALYKPHQVVGGDYYDFFQISEDETVFCIADVSGKGISAAMLMSNFQAMMHALLEHDQNLKNIARSLNERVASNAQGEKFITSFIALYDHRAREITYVNCGHQPALFCHQGKVRKLDQGSPVLGAFKELPHLKIGKQKVEIDDVMICFTDGVCEAENEKKEEYGTKEMEDIMPKFKGKKSKDLVQAIFTSLDEFRGEQDFPDDLALLSIRFSQ